MGLDILFYKTKKYEDCKTIDDFYKRGHADRIKQMTRLIDEWIADFRDESKNYSETYKHIVYEEMPRLFTTNTWLFEELTEEERPLEYVLSFFEKQRTNLINYGWDIAYFRKANFIYHYFKDRLVDEECFVTKADVQDLMEKSLKILETDGKLHKHREELKEIEGEILTQTTTLAKLAEEGKDTTLEQEKLNLLKGKRQAVKDAINELEKDTGYCEKLLPTQCGFFFGSTEYDDLYFYKVESCYKQMKFILEDFNEDEEVLFVYMSW